MQIGRYPAIVILYGGPWQRGSPKSNEEFSRYMAAKGYCVVAIDYHHAPQYGFWVQLEDVEAALSYIKTHADEWFIDIDRIALMGRSAAVYLASLYAYRSTTVPVQAVVNYYGSNDLLRGYYDHLFPTP